MPSNRLLSLDAFRGYTIAAMILVNNPGDWGNVYAPLLHKSWNGITPTDLIFPFFLFIMGVAITLAFTKKITVQSSNKLLYKKY
jgi:predicted acyltransferase